MTRILMVVVVWVLALIAAGWGDAEHWRMLAGPLTVVTGLAAIGIFALGAGGIVYYGAGVTRLHHELRRHRMRRRPLG